MKPARCCGPGVGALFFLAFQCLPRLTQPAQAALDFREGSWWFFFCKRAIIKTVFLISHFPRLPRISLNWHLTYLWPGPRWH